MQDFSRLNYDSADEFDLKGSYALAKYVMNRPIDDLTVNNLRATLYANAKGSEVSAVAGSVSVLGGIALSAMSIATAGWTLATLLPVAGIAASVYLTGSALNAISRYNAESNLLAQSGMTGHLEHLQDLLDQGVDPRVITHDVQILLIHALSQNRRVDLKALAYDDRNLLAIDGHDDEYDEIDELIDEPIAVKPSAQSHPIAAVPSFTSPNLAPPKTRTELIDRLKTDCPLLLKLVKAHPIRAVGVQRSGKTTLVKTLTLLRMALMENHRVVASTPHYEAANPYPEAFDVVGVTPDGRRDYPAIERAWYRMASDVESCQKGNVTYIWDEFGLQDKAIPITPEDDPIKTVLTSCLRETMKFQIYPIFILHGETAAFLPGSKGLVTVIMASTVRVETIGESVEGEDGLEMIQPTGRFNVTWLDGSKGEGVLPAWLTEKYLTGMIAPRDRASQKPTTPFIATQLSKAADPLTSLEDAYRLPAVEVEIQAVVSTRPNGLDDYPLVATVWEYLEGKDPRSIKQIADAMKAKDKISETELRQRIELFDTYKSAINQVVMFGVSKGLIVKVSEDAFTATKKH